jgi:squalene-hopene/tetraprenyl-beta-curcumene cyclase
MNWKVWLATLALGLGAAIAAAQSGPEKPAVPNHAPPALDPRITQPARITEYDPPPLPEQVTLPLGPVHRIAADAAAVPIGRDHWDRALAAIRGGLAFLRQSQHESGGWLVGAAAAPTDQADRPAPVAVAVTALAIKAIIQADPETPGNGRFRSAVRFVLSARRADGSFDTSSLANYITASVVMGLSALDDREVADELLEAVHWLQVSQWDQGEGLGARQDWYGGAGYGSHGRPDLSNTQTMLDALYDAGISPDEPAMQRALAFISRAQNLQATNKAAWAGNDGGFVYTPANGGESMASEAAGEGRAGELVAAGEPRSLRSYGSMTYAGFKSMLYAGLSPGDVRVRAAYDWIRRHWTFEENPGLGPQGLYYYLHTMARALRVAQQNSVQDVHGTSHNWREELIDSLARRQRPDGSWRNEADRWLEGEPVLATIYSLLALEEALKPVEPSP